jgi:hypothetical protein
MKEKLQKSAKSTNFWTNVSTIVSGLIVIALVHSVEDSETVKQIIMAYLSSSGIHNAGNILAHTNKD